MAIKKRTEPTVDLVVDQQEEITLTIIIGNAQIGGSVIKFIDTPQVFKKGAINNLLLGKGEDLVGRKLKITTSVLDSNTATNKIVVTNTFTNCLPGAFQFDDQVNSAGDIFQLITLYNFK